jgi:hypothetical protein
MPCAPPGVLDAGQVRLRWIGHQIRAGCEIVVDPDIIAAQAHEVTVSAEHALLHAISRLSAALVHAAPAAGQPHEVLADSRPSPAPAPASPEQPCPGRGPVAVSALPAVHRAVPVLFTGQSLPLLAADVLRCQHAVTACPAARHPVVQAAAARTRKRLGCEASGCTSSPVPRSGPRAKNPGQAAGRNKRNTIEASTARPPPQARCRPGR